MRLQAIKNFFLHQSAYSFEVMWAFFCMYAGIVAATGWGITASPLTIALGSTIAMIFNIAFFLAGAGMFFGIGFRKGNIEAFGVILLGTVLLIRTFVSIWLFGITPTLIHGYILNCAFIVSCVVRLWIIWGWASSVNELSRKNG